MTFATPDPWLPPGPAWSDAATRRTFARQLARAVGLVIGGAVVMFLVAAALLQEDGSARDGIPETVTVIAMCTGLLPALAGVAGIVGLARIAIALRRPWLLVTSTYAELAAGTPNGQPVLDMVAGHRRWRLTLAAFAWRWKHFAQPGELLFAGRRKGAVATTDRRHLVWAGQSLMTSFLTWRQRG